MSWGGLNPALTAWRNAYNKRLPGRGTASDGGYADPNHGSKSQHQPDSDGTVDANDMDVNVLGSGTSTGTQDELRIIEAMKLDFERDPHGRGHLWIHNREIAQHDEGWDEDYYGGESPHTEHVHWESRQDREDDGREWPMPETDRVLKEMGRGEVVYPLNKGDNNQDVGYHQYILSDLGYNVGTVDNDYGDKTAAAVNAFRAAHGQPSTTAISAWTGKTMLTDLIKKHAGKNGKDGAPGKDGADGAPGKDGADGAPGKDGADGQLSGTFTVTGGSIEVQTA